ncbi:hypothetical protein [Myxococcus xanthus]|uniref:Uncharacterized protein n=1 Tax=Myxococcus xanthus TaxID=34 RepID=A0A7Y4IJ31_MYXXA|nr:hypothetical protein [Myxococcus xanthus]NOJ79790.1 hypothetical protein [Myxococcus xanthus]NOJ86795.1 hypothetical protein [Myxococcus xanthus]
MRIHLSALGWIDDKPRGHRLRWHYPVQAIVAGSYLGLPKRIVVERAPLDPKDLYQHPLASAQYPYDWWEARPDVSVFGFVPPYAYTLRAPVQGIRFDYQGSPARIVIRDAASGVVAYDRLVTSGESVYAEAALLDRVDIYATWAMLSNLHVLDLFKSHGLPFQPIAEIEVAATYAEPLATIAARYGMPVTIATTEWSELVDTVDAANVSSPATEEPGTPTAWEAVQIVLGLRWEFALLGGFAFFDGPRESVCALDHLGDAILKEPPGTLMAYRVRDRDGPTGRSNLVVCAPWPAPALAAPSAPWYVDPEVRLRAKRTVFPGSGVPGSSPSLAQFTPILAFDGDYNVRATLAWLQSDPRALGVEVEEVVGASAATGSPARTTTFMSRSRRIDDPPLQGSVARNFDVAFIDVTLRSRARAIDAWDRVSAKSAWSTVTPLALHHAPMAPPLESGVHESGLTRIRRARGRPDIPDWQPDPIVEHAGGQVFVYRRTIAPRTANATASGPWPVSPGLYRVNVTGVAGLADFVGGTLSVGAFSDTIVASGASTVDIAIPDNGSPVTLFGADTARLAQDPFAPALWMHVATFAAVGLPDELVFAEALPAPGGLVVESYSARVAFLGRVGPFGTAATIVRVPTVPVVPPPFVVDVLGLDFYRRTMIKLRFTTPPSAGLYTVWWADGNIPAAQFPRRGATGTYGAQQPAGGDVLYDVLPLPIPAHVDRTVTIGVQRVLEGGVQGDFVTVSIVLAALGA